MKQFLTIVSCLFITAGSSVAQHPQSDSSAHFGVKGGLCFANQKLTCHTSEGSWSLDSHYRTGLDAGAFVELPMFSQELACMLEIHYVQKGMTDEMAVTDENGPETKGTWCDNYKVEYLSVPVLFKWRIPRGTVTPFALFGPRLDFFLSSRVSTKIEPSSVEQKVPASYRGYHEGVTFNKFDFGATVGLGVEAAVKPGLSVLLEARYDHSFTQSFETSTRTIRNRSFQILAGIRLPMKGIGIKVNAEKN